MLTRAGSTVLPTHLLAPASSASGLLVAVSGGPDSMALLELAARWRDEAIGDGPRRGESRPPLFAATVDHGLRANAVEEARLAADFAASRAVPHRILRWTGEKPATRLQERARAARYALLADAARAVGADMIMTAHHADDQAETVLMRLLRGSAIAGLAGMAATSRREGLVLFRPLLGVRKADLVDFCAGAGVPFARDPSNEDPRFGRTGARRLAAMLEAEGLGAAEWARLARRASRAEAALADAARRALEQLPGAQGDPLPMGALADLPEEIALRCLATRACAAGGRDFVRLERLEAAWGRLAQAHKTGAALTLTLAGARLRLDARGFLAIAAEPPRRRGASAAASSQCVHAIDEKSADQGDQSGARRAASLGNGTWRA